MKRLISLFKYSKLKFKNQKPVTADDFFKPIRKDPIWANGTFNSFLLAVFLIKNNFFMRSSGNLEEWGKGTEISGQKNAELFFLGDDSKKKPKYFFTAC